jgi:hypothetical protein
MRQDFLIILSLLLAGCQKFDTPKVAGMTAREKASYLALEKYFSCMAPIVEKAKSGPSLSDEQIRNFGFRGCLPQLQEAARKREEYFSIELRDVDHQYLDAPTQAKRIRRHQEDIAGNFQCYFRQCSNM